MNKTDAFRLKVEKALHARKELYTLVPVLRKVQHIVGDESSSVSQLGEVIRSDSVLTSKVLRVVNSALFALDRHISDIEEAVVVIGYVELRNLFTGLMSASIVSGKNLCEGFDSAAMWKHSLGVARASSVVQKEYAPELSVDIYTAALLCNIGRTILAQCFPDEFSTVMLKAKEKNISLLEAEFSVLGVSHAEVGFWAAEAWHFDETLAHAIRHHHGPSGSKAADILNLSYVVTQALGVGYPADQRLAVFLPGLFKRLKVSDLDLDRLIIKLVEDFATLEPMFHLADMVK